MRKVIGGILSCLLLLTSVSSFVCAGGNVAKIGTTEYATLQAAFTACDNNETIDLLANVTESVYVSPGTTKTYILDLHNFNVTSKNAGDEAIDISSSKGNLYIKGTGKIIQNDNTTYAIYCGGSLTIEGPSIETSSTDPTIECFSVLTFINGKFSGRLTCDSNIVIKGGTFKNTIILKGNGNSDYASLSNYLTDSTNYNYDTTTTAGSTIVTRKAISVTYDGNNADSGSVTDALSLTYVEADNVTVKDKGDLVKEGFLFSGWNTKQDGTGTSYSKDDVITLYKDDVTLYAMWEIDPSNVPIVENNTVSNNDTTIYKDESCEAVIGPRWHWNEKSRKCDEEYYVINTATY